MSAGVLLLHAWWGLNDDVRAYAERLRGESYLTEVPDLYHGRVATTIVLTPWPTAGVMA